MDLLAHIEAARANPAMRGWMKALRWFLAVIFLWPGMEKLLGYPFLRAADEPGLLPFFTALHDVSLYWRFIGLGQVTAGLLLLSRRTALWGVLLCVPIYANIVAILLALPFDVASVIAGHVFLGLNLLLLVWYAPELAPIFRASSASRASIWFSLRHAWRNAWVRRITMVGIVALVALHVLAALDWL